MGKLPVILGLGAAAGVIFLAFRKANAAPFPDPPKSPGECPDDWPLDMCFEYWDLVNGGIERKDALATVCAKYDKYGCGCPSWREERGGISYLVTPTCAQGDATTVRVICNDAYPGGRSACEQNNPGFIRELPAGHWMNMTPEEQAAVTAENEAKAQEEAARFAAEHAAAMSQQDAIQAEHLIWWRSGNLRQMIDAFQYGVLVYGTRLDRADIYNQRRDKPDLGYFPGSEEKIRQQVQRLDSLNIWPDSVVAASRQTGEARWEQLSLSHKQAAILDYMATVWVKSGSWVESRFLTTRERPRRTGETLLTDDAPVYRFVAVWQPQTIQQVVGSKVVHIAPVQMTVMAGSYGRYVNIGPRLYMRR